MVSICKPRFLKATRRTAAVTGYSSTGALTCLGDQANAHAYASPSAKLQLPNLNVWWITAAANRLHIVLTKSRVLTNLDPLCDLCVLLSPRRDGCQQCVVAVSQTQLGAQAPLPRACSSVFKVPPIFAVLDGFLQGRIVIAASVGRHQPVQRRQVVKQTAAVPVIGQ